VYPPYEDRLAEVIRNSELIQTCSKQFHPGKEKRPEFTLGRELRVRITTKALRAFVFNDWWNFLSEFPRDSSLPVARPPAEVLK
jgi:hypothetical protein